MELDYNINNLIIAYISSKIGFIYDGMIKMATSTTYYRDYIFVKHSSSSYANNNIFDSAATLKCTTNEQFVQEDVDIVSLDNNKHIKGTFFSCLNPNANENSITERGLFAKQKDYQVNINNSDILTKNRERKDISPVVIQVNPNDNIITTKKYVFIQSEKDLQTGTVQPVSEQDLDKFFHVEWDYGMIGFVIVMAMLMIGFATKYMLYMPYSVAENITELPNKNTASQSQHYKSNVNVDDEIKKL